MYIQAHIHIHKIKRHLKNLKEFTTLFALFIFLIFLLVSTAVSNCCGAVSEKRETQKRLCSGTQLCWEQEEEEVVAAEEE